MSSWRLRKLLGSSPITTLAPSNAPTVLGRTCCRRLRRLPRSATTAATSVARGARRGTGSRPAVAELAALVSRAATSTSNGDRAARAPAAVRGARRDARGHRLRRDPRAAGADRDRVLRAALGCGRPGRAAARVPPPVVPLGADRRASRRGWCRCSRATRADFRDAQRCRPGRPAVAAWRWTRAVDRGGARPRGQRRRDASRCAAAGARRSITAARDGYEQRQVIALAASAFGLAASGRRRPCAAGRRSSTYPRMLAPVERRRAGARRQRCSMLSAGPVRRPPGDRAMSELVLDCVTYTYPGAGPAGARRCLPAGRAGRVRRAGGGLGVGQVDAAARGRGARAALPRRRVRGPAGRGRARLARARPGRAVRRSPARCSRIPRRRS